MKVLIIRLSSIGDIVLTTPTVRSLAHAGREVEIHYLVKKTFYALLAANPYIHTIHVFDKDLKALLRDLRAEKFDFVLDLHNNLRSLRIKTALGRPYATLNKENYQKFLLTKLKNRKVDIAHIVERYADTLKPLGIALDAGGLDCFIPDSHYAQAKSIWETAGLWENRKNVLAVVLGGTYYTKRWPPEYFVELIQRLNRPVVLLGGKDSLEEVAQIIPHIQVPCIDAVGRYELLSSAALMHGCGAVLTHDTGLMHIAAALQMKVFSLWGNTVPEYGMTPYHTDHHILEIKGLGCRPCSRLGFDRCPKGHFKCMRDLKPETVLHYLEQFAFGN